VGAVLVASAGATGALAGFVLALPWAVAGAGSATALVCAALLAAAAAADLVLALTGRPRPWAVRRQVPREWGRVFPPAGAALLYGARLGVGPLTILSTWLWWAVVLAAATLGPGPSALVGTAFGVVRCVVMVAVASVAAHDMPRRMAAVRSAEASSVRVVSTVAVALAFLTMVAA
jgi:hypothetical protein